MQNMKQILALSLRLAAARLLVGGLAATAAEPTFWSWAKTPPMGWNSWDCYGAGVWESNLIANADYLARHHQHELLHPAGNGARMAMLAPQLARVRADVIQELICNDLRRQYSAVNL